MLVSDLLFFESPETKNSFLNSNQVIKSLKDIFESSNYNFDLDDVTISIATQKGGN